MATRPFPAVTAATREGEIEPGSFVSAYRIEALVGTGGMGWVYRARHALTNREVAIKILREEQVAQDRAIERMMREATILASVSHPGIPRFFECGLREDRRVWIAMELVEGMSLAERLQHGLLCADEVIRLLGSVTSVLAAAHNRGVTHRDLKPDNIFLTPHDAHFPVRVLDWGIAHHHAGSRFTAMNEAIGTPTYMSPEQARGGPTDGHCDVYGLGVVAYQALCGKPPFLGQTSVEILVQHLNRPFPPLGPRCSSATPAWLIALVESMLAKSVDERPSAADVERAIRRATSRQAADDSGYLALEVVPADGVPESWEGERTAKTALMRAPRLPSK